MHEWFVYQDFDAASSAAAAFIASVIKQSSEQRGQCHVILPGGNTPGRCLGLLAEENLPWHQVHWYLGDERCFPQGHAERNDVMLQQYLWSKINNTNIHRIPAELGAEKAAMLYSKIIETVTHFDLAFLGMGEDGHTASLFPGNQALEDRRCVVPVYHSPKPPAERVSLSLETLRKVQHRLVLAHGEAKASVIARIKDGEPLPINCLGNIDWYVDEAAVSLSGE